MASFRFIGQYTGGRTSINMSGFTFDGHEPCEVDDPDAVRRLRGNPEFEEAGENAGNLESVNELRAAYRRKYGKNPGPRWDAATLREKLA